MASLGVVERLNILEYGDSRRFTRGVNGVANPFCFQAAEEPLHARVVPAVAFAAHAAANAKEF